ncbi:MAG: hypothetical protein HY814_02485 [Candidatus Riflebacteria bacterium]|nr:hypothetical protein [Candidatus Riflebacteria bacterium]
MPLTRMVLHRVDEPDSLDQDWNQRAWRSEIVGWRIAWSFAKVGDFSMHPAENWGMREFQGGTAIPVQVMSAC